MQILQEQISAGATPNVLICFEKGACVARHDGVVPLSNSYGYYWHDDALSCHATRAQNRKLFMGQDTR
jgi:hypothetical protein